MRSLLTTLVIVSTVLIACDGRSAFDEASPLPSVAATPTDAPGPVEGAEQGERAVTIPKPGRIVFHEVGIFAFEIRRAIADLKRVGVWKELTSHIFQIDLSVRSGRENIPKDDHLADARFWRAPMVLGTEGVGGEQLGIYCWVRFFPSAMVQDLYRWRSLYDQGMTGRVPPSRRQFWASILGHELYHCPEAGKKTRPEPAALAWEQRILDKLAASGIE
jgi:hypothetical protein